MASAATLAACSDGGANPPGDNTAGATAAGTTSAGGGGAGGSAGLAGASNGGSGGAVAGNGGSAGGAGAGGGGAGGAVATGCVVPPSGEDAPMLLSQTGCVNMANPSQPAPGLIPYAVRSPLWSDAAEKHRFLRLADGGKIKVLDCSTQPEACASNSVSGDDGHWEVPPGSVLVKNFSIEGKLIETRLVMRRSMTRWAFYGYEWNDTGTEATLLPDDTDGKDKPVGTGTQVWHFPGRQQCPQCHTAGAGFALGPSTPQLNSDFPYAEGTMNQVEKFKQLGLFEAPPPAMAGYPDPAGTDSLDQRAWSYMEANCAICHRPAGEYASVDLRWGTPMEKTALCAEVDRDPQNVPKYRLVPGDPSKSTMSFRMHALDKLRMPKIGSNVVDPAGTQLIDDWIAAMPKTACPDQQP